MCSKSSFRFRRGSLISILVAIFVLGTDRVDAEPVATPLSVSPFFVALSVDDVEASARWYSRVLGFEITRSVDLPERGFRIRMLRRSDALLELVESKAAESLKTLQPSISKRHQLHGVFKVGFVVDDLDATVDRLGVMKVPLRGEVVTEADGSLRSLQIEDPDGNVIQLFEVLEVQDDSDG